MVVGCLHGGSEEFRCQVEVRAGSSLGPRAGLRASRRFALIVLSTIWTRASWKTKELASGRPPFGDVFFRGMVKNCVQAVAVVWSRVVRLHLAPLGEAVWSVVRFLEALGECVAPCAKAEPRVC